MKKFTKSPDDPLPNAWVNNSLQSVLTIAEIGKVGGMIERTKKLYQSRLMMLNNPMKTIKMVK